MMMEKKYYDFVVNHYQPSKYEWNELNDSRFKEGTYYSHVCKTRSYLVYREIAKNKEKISKILDMGFFPGTILRQLKIIFHSQIHCYGVGLNIDNEFRNYMLDYLEDCFDLELDPFYAGLTSSISLPLPSNSFDVIIATEILEHLISPIEMISEGARILRSGGIFIITTPNVSHIGAVLKILRGKSNYERLDRSPMYLKMDKWRGHVRFYDKDELKKLFGRSGLILAKHSYYNEKGWRHARWPLIKRLIVQFSDIFCTIYREGHFAVFQKR